MSKKWRNHLLEWRREDKPYPTLPTHQSGFRLQQLGKARLLRGREVTALGLDLLVGAAPIAPPRNDEEHQRTAAEQCRRTEPQHRRVQREARLEQHELAVARDQ